MKNFKLTNTQRATCYNVLNVYNGERGHQINDTLWVIKEIMDAISKGIVRTEHPGGQTSINFDGCDEKEIISLRRHQVDKIISALKGYPWMNVLAGVSASEIVKILEDAPDEKDPSRKE